MICPICKHPNSEVVDSRYKKDLDIVKRRRRCGKCLRRFSTIEKTNGQELPKLDDLKNKLTSCKLVITRVLEEIEVWKNEQNNDQTKPISNLSQLNQKD